MSNDDDQVRLNNMIATLKENYNWPDLKIGKWLGYIEGILIANKITTVDEERDYSRPYYHQYYKEMNINIPTTTDVMQREI